MLPRKKPNPFSSSSSSSPSSSSSSSSKKSNPTNKPHPSKFGIQHFFQRHTQNALLASQKSQNPKPASPPYAAIHAPSSGPEKSGLPVPNPRNDPGNAPDLQKPDSKHNVSAYGPNSASQNTPTGNVAVMDVISDENLLEGSQANDQNSDNVSVMDVSSDEDLPEGSQPQANDPNGASQSTPTDNIEVMDISSDEELPDVSPAVSKPKFSPTTVNVAPKRFKVVHTKKVGSSSARREVLEQQSGNTNHPEEPHGGGEVEVNIVDRAGDRGRAGIGRMTEVWNLPEGRKIPILCNDFGQPLDIEGHVYTRFLGSIARTHSILPINFNNWKKVPKTNKEAAWNVILSKFLLPDDGGQYEVIKTWSMKDLRDKWKNWKHNLKKKYFDESKTAEQVVAKAPLDKVDVTQYTELVHYWYSEEGKIKSDKAKKSRSEQHNHHAAGSKSYARHAYDMEKSTGVKPNRAQVYIATHKCKDGTPLNDEIGRKIAQMEELLAQEPPNSQGGKQGSIVWSLNDAYAQVIGPGQHGRVRGLGKNLTPSSHLGYRKKSSFMDEVVEGASREKDKQEIAALKDYVVKLEDKMSSLHNMVQHFIQRMDIQGHFGPSDPDHNSPCGRSKSSAASHTVAAPCDG